jgi:tRNA (guanine-N7-)-methyltransferase
MGRNAMGRRRRRRDGTPPNQINPLKQQYFDCELFLPCNWLYSTYADISKPFVLDLGCGEGEWCISAARQFPEYNYLGLEIRVEALRVGCKKADYPVSLINDEENCYAPPTCPGNIGFIHSNILRGDLHEILGQMQSNSCAIRFIAVQFPDPHWKKKHRKRRILGRSLLLACAANLEQNGVMYIQSDAKNVVDDVEHMLVAEGHDGLGCFFDCARHTSPPPSLPVLEEGANNQDHDQDQDGCNAANTGHDSDEEETEGSPPCCDGVAESSRFNSDAFLSLPPCFHEVSTERNLYVRRQNKGVHHLVCRLRDEAFRKRSVLSIIRTHHHQQQRQQEETPDDDSNKEKEDEEEAEGIGKNKRGLKKQNDIETTKDATNASDISSESSNDSGTRDVKRIRKSDETSKN